MSASPLSWTSQGMAYETPPRESLNSPPPLSSWEGRAAPRKSCPVSPQQTTSCRQQAATRHPQASLQDVPWHPQASPRGASKCLADRHCARGATRPLQPHASRRRHSSSDRARRKIPREHVKMKKLGARPVRGLKGSMRRSIGRTRRNHASILRGHAVLQSFGLNNSEESLPPKRSPGLARCNAGGCNTFGAFDHFKCSLQNIRPETYRSKTFGSKMYRNCAPTYDSAKNVPKLCSDI